MTYGKLCITAVLIGLLFVTTGAGATGAPIAIGRIVLEDESPGTMATVEHAVRRSLSMQGVTVSPSTSGDQSYTLNVYHKGTDHARSFNWWILLFPAWPFVGITQSHTTVYVESNVVDADGSIAWTGSGEAKGSAWFFSDFYYPSPNGLLPTAADRSVRGVGSIAAIPKSNTFQVAVVRF